MSLHINALNTDIAPVVLMPGDPLRAKFMAERFLSDVRQVAGLRNMYYFTGLYHNRLISIGGSGMGCPSIGIYSYELYSFYDVKSIIRIGTAGAYSTELSVFDLVNVEKAYSESTLAKEAFGYSENHHVNQGACFEVINDTATRLNKSVKSMNIHSSDVFYRSKKGVPEIAEMNDCKAVEMEAFSLFATARYLNKMAGTLLTISDVIPTGEEISPKEREQALLPMMELALESAVVLLDK
jgi:purine-nucleoside phosphorylase